MEWWQLLIILIVAGLFVEEIVGMIVKAYVIKNTKEEKNDDDNAVS